MWQICQVQHPCVEAGEADAAGGNCPQPVVRLREASGHRDDGVRVTAEAGRRAYRVLEAGGAAARAQMAEPWQGQTALLNSVA